MRRFLIVSWIVTAAAFMGAGPALSGSAPEPGKTASPTIRGIIDVDLLIASDVPTLGLATLGGLTTLTIQPSDIVLYHGATGTYSTVLSVPGSPSIQGIYKMDAPGSYLFSVEAPNTLAGALTSPATGRDIVRYNGATTTYSTFFCGGAVPATPVPDTSRVDAFYLDGGDGGSLVMSFDVPTRIGAFRFQPADLVRFTRTGAGCGDWQLAASNPVFNAASFGIPSSVNVEGASRYGTKTLLSFDVPFSLGPLSGTPVVPGEVVAWDGAGLSVFTSMTSWPISSLANGIAAPGNPGRVADDSLTVTKSPSVGGNILLSWAASCSQGGSDYGIYEGTLGSWYSHTKKACTDTGHDLQEEITPSSGSRYYLVVPLNGAAEGSYGTASGNVERPPASGSGACVPSQVVTPCPS